MSESILNENLIATFEQSLRQTRNAQNRLMVRLREVETEGDRLREEIEALESSAEQTEAAIYSILATMGSKSSRPQKDKLRTDTYDTNLEITRGEQYKLDRADYHNSDRRIKDDYSPRNFRDEPPVAYIKSNRDTSYYQNNRNYRNDNVGRSNRDNSRNVPQVGQNIEPISQRFADRTITQACTLLLRESENPLHVNELYNFLVAGGFKFKGNNPTISIAVSLNRNRRFKKVSPGTFDLVMRDASQAAS